MQGLSFVPQKFCVLNGLPAPEHRMAGTGIQEGMISDRTAENRRHDVLFHHGQVGVLLCWSEVCPLAMYRIVEDSLMRHWCRTNAEAVERIDPTTHD